MCDPNWSSFTICGVFLIFKSFTFLSSFHFTAANQVISLIFTPNQLFSKPSSWAAHGGLSAVKSRSNSKQWLCCWIKPMFARWNKPTLISVRSDQNLQTDGKLHHLDHQHLAFSACVGKSWIKRLSCLIHADAGGHGGRAARPQHRPLAVQHRQDRPARGGLRWVHAAVGPQ